MPTDEDLFAEEQSMPTMSFGEHIEDLRKHLILALLGLLVGVLITFIPPLSLGARVLRKMEAPATAALEKFHAQRMEARAKDAAEKQELTEPSTFRVDLADLAEALRRVVPTPARDQIAPNPEAFRGQFVALKMQQERADQIRQLARNVDLSTGVITLGPLEGFTIFMLVCLVTGLVISSPWVFYQLWLFIAAGLYRHERYYVKKFLPLALGLFLGGVALCFFVVLPVTLNFLLEFNVWLGIDPSMRLSEWIGFATMFPLIFGICFQTPLVMLILERLGIFTAADFRAKRKFAILIMVVAAAFITPTQDPFSLALLAVPMILLYELGLFLIGTSAGKRAPDRPVTA